MDDSDGRYLTTSEVAARLGVKTETVYAYVSRGLLASVRVSGRRGSLFSEHDVDQFAGRSRENRPAAGVVERIATAVTLLEDDLLYYRGVEAGELATTRSLESVARFLWTGRFGDDGAGGHTPFSSAGELAAVARAAAAPLPASARLTDHLRVVVAVLGAADPLRFDLSPAAVVRTGEIMLAAMVDALPRQAPADHGATDEPVAGPADGAARPRAAALADRLWPALSRQEPRSELLNAALILLADHGLAASTVAARVAASARAHPYAVVSAGLGALDAQYHGASSSETYRFLAEAMAGPLVAVSERLRAGTGVPGFGHRVYQERDPRADLLLRLLRQLDGAGPVLAAVDAVADELGRGGLWPPNIDLALAAMMHACGMRPDAGEAVFAVARTIGWIAHALEEYQEPGLRFRPRGVYTGPRPAPAHDH
ncbi:excisionase family DNA-binding protein [Phytoactinopolyspora alkaliphila]|uniref:citrate synthase (unknown stereospecificity) n=1 Tax=Phytoactinopolyspora alkaliphila TaxID=1783498 RepID=A0A6N9YIN7_9ACTN|nr:citrate synthase [Phytoactinopolyspora alkaliphila]NED94822.1 excisionase family DNA-binding protein [Phytoactinopolyspora alkaliphila]